MKDFRGMKRQRSRNRNKSQGGNPNNPNRTYESNGPDSTKVRGNAQTIYEKYQQLARDANSSGDRVLAENYLQHAEHYFRMIRMMQPQRPVSEFVQRDPFATYFDEYDDELDSESSDDSDSSAPSQESSAQPSYGGSQNNGPSQNNGGYNGQNNGGQNSGQNNGQNNNQYNNGSRSSRRESRREQYERRKHERLQEQEQQVAPVAPAFIASTEPLGGGSSTRSFAPETTTADAGRSDLPAFLTAPRSSGPSPLVPEAAAETPAAVADEAAPSAPRRGRPRRSRSDSVAEEA
jgi:Domain of unknown function (DUF4167)